MAKTSTSSSLSTRHIVLISILMVAVCVMIYIYFISPLRTRIAALDRSIADLTAQVTQARAFQAQLPELQEQVRQLRERLGHLSAVLPTSRETAEIVRQVERLAVESNLDLRNFTPQQTVQKDFYQDWPILLSVEGTFDSLGLFLEKIAQYQRLINVDNISIRPIEEDKRSRTRTIAATCTATTYVFVEGSNDS